MRRVRRLAGQVGKWVVLAVVVEYLVVPQIAGTRNSWHLLLGVDNAWLLLAVGLEIASLAVEQSRHGQGIGRRLVEAAVLRAHTRGARRLPLPQGRCTATCTEGR